MLIFSNKVSRQLWQWQPQAQSAAWSEYLWLDTVVTSQVTDVTFRKIVGYSARTWSTKCISRHYFIFLSSVKNQNKRNNNLALAQHVDFEKYSARIYLNKNPLWRKKAENIFTKITIKSMISMHNPNKNIYFSNVSWTCVTYGQMLIIL